MRYASVSVYIYIYIYTYIYIRVRVYMQRGEKVTEDGCNERGGRSLVECDASLLCSPICDPGNKCVQYMVREFLGL